YTRQKNVSTFNFYRLHIVVVFTCLPVTIPQLVLHTRTYIAKLARISCFGSRTQMPLKTPDQLSVEPLLRIDRSQILSLLDHIFLIERTKAGPFNGVVTALLRLQYCGI